LLKNDSKREIVDICPPGNNSSPGYKTKKMSTTPLLSPVNRQRLKVSTAIMRALAHPLRIRMLTYIDECESACVNDIFQALQIKQAVASQHLRVLRQAELVYTKRQGKFIFYALHYDKIGRASDIAKLI
jgi:ArsR family transcriptional regulator